MLPLPTQHMESEPRWVTQKQYDIIIERRAQRKQFEQTHVVVKRARNYTHESRHVHAQKRQRSTGGRFAKKAKVQDSSSSSVTVTAASLAPPLIMPD